jgi:hypothetical protein
MAPAPRSCCTLRAPANLTCYPLPMRPPYLRLQGAPNVLSAREFVWWYNGHPDCRDLPVDLSKVGAARGAKAPAAPAACGPWVQVARWPGARGQVQARPAPEPCQLSPALRHSPASSAQLSSARLGSARGHRCRWRAWPCAASATWPWTAPGCC